MIAVRCECGGKFKVADQYAGKRGKCPACGKKLIVPQADGYLSDDEPPPDEGFEGVAGLLDEALAPAKPAAALNPLPAAIAAPPRRKKSSRSLTDLLAKLSEHVVSIIVLGVMIAITLGAVWGGSVAWHRFNFSQTLGGGDAQAALQEVTADLQYAVSYANSISGDMDMTTRRRVQMLTRVLGTLPEGTDLSPLLELKPSAMPYGVAFDLVKKRATFDWLIESSCNSSKEGRTFAAEVLRGTFPFGRLDDAGLAQLAESTSVSEKQTRYDDLYAALHRSYEQKLAGVYRLQFDAIWQSDAAVKETGTFLARPRLAVSCKDYVWSIDFYGHKWTGKIDELPQLSIACPAKDTGDDLEQLPQPQSLSAATLRVTCLDESLRVSIEQFPTYSAASRGSVPVQRDLSSRIGGGIPGVPDGATTRQVTIYNNARVLSESIEWTLPERPGFSKLDVRLVRAAAR